MGGGFVCFACAESAPRTLHQQVVAGKRRRAAFVARRPAQRTPRLHRERHRGPGSHAPPVPAQHCHVRFPPFPFNVRETACMHPFYNVATHLIVAVVVSSMRMISSSTSRYDSEEKSANAMLDTRPIYYHTTTRVGTRCLRRTAAVPPAAARRCRRMVARKRCFLHCLYCALPTPLYPSQPSANTSLPSHPCKSCTCHTLLPSGGGGDTPSTCV